MAAAAAAAAAVYACRSIVLLAYPTAQPDPVYFTLLYFTLLMMYCGVDPSYLNKGRINGVLCVLDSDSDGNYGYD